MVTKLARKLALWHSIDRQNRLQILYGLPIYGTNLRNTIKVTQVCNDIFDSRQYKYSKNIYSLPQAVFNPFSPNKKKPMLMEEWPQYTDPEIEQINSKNLIIKEITCKTREAIRLKKERKEHEERMKQPKKVQRRIEEEIEYEDTTFDLIIDIAALKNAEMLVDEIAEDEVKPDNQNVTVKEETIQKTKKSVKVFEETITMEQYLKEQGEELKIDEKPVTEI